MYEFQNRLQAQTEREQEVAEQAAEEDAEHGFDVDEDEAAREQDGRFATGSCEYCPRTEVRIARTPDGSWICEHCWYEG